MTLDDLVDAFSNISDKTIYEEIKHFETWDRWLELMDVPRHPKPTRKELIEDWIETRWNEFIYDLELNAHLSDGKLVVHRCIEVKDPATFVNNLESGKKNRKYRGLGIFWTWSFEKAECHWGSARDKNVILTGLVDLNAINIEDTLLANFHPDIGEEEKEIRLKEGSQVLLTSVSFSDTDPRWRFDPPLRLVA